MAGAELRELVTQRFWGTCRSEYSSSPLRLYGKGSPGTPAETGGNPPVDWE
jgi:hypothetical protein